MMTLRVAAMPRILWLCGAILVMSTAMSFGQPAPAQEKSKDSPATKAPPAKPVADPPLIDQQGYQDIITKYRGKPLIINFWATWCEPCREEYPMLNELAKKYAPEGLQIVGVTLDDDGDMILVRRFLARNLPVFPNFRKPPGKDEQFINGVNPKWSGVLPASFFYARDGRLIGQIFGEGTRETFEAAIRTLLAPASPPGGTDAKK